MCSVDVFLILRGTSNPDNSGTPSPRGTAGMRTARLLHRHVVVDDGRLLLIIVSLRRSPQPAHWCAAQWNSFDPQRWRRRNAILHRRIRCVSQRIPGYAELRRPSCLTIGRTRSILAKECAGIGVQLHGRFDFVFIRAVANVDALHHWGIRGKAMGLS